MNITQNIAIIITLVLILLVFGIRWKLAKELKINFEITTGKIQKFTNSGLHYTIKDYRPKYVNVEGITYPKWKNCISTKIKKYRKLDFVVVYQKNDKTNSEILLFKDQYEKYKIEIPTNILDEVIELTKCKEGKNR